MKIFHVTLKNGEFILSQDNNLENSIIIQVEDMGEPKRFIFRYKISIKNSTLNLKGWKFKDVVLDVNNSLYYKDYYNEFEIECESADGIKYKQYFLGIFPPRRLAQSGESNILAVILAIYLIVLSNNPEIANDIYTNICTPFSIPRSEVDWLVYSMHCLKKITDKLSVLRNLQIESKVEVDFYNYLISLYEKGVNKYCDYIKDTIKNKVK